MPDIESGIMGKKEKTKEKYTEYTGLFHNGIDYAVYHMSKKEIILGAILGGVAGATVVQIFFQILLMTVIIFPLCCLLGIKIYKNILLNKRKHRLLMQFRDMIEAVSSSLGGGRNVKDAFVGARDDMKSQYGQEAEIVQELEIICAGLESNMNLEILLQDFAKRSHNENIKNFADVFSVANRKGGNIRQIIFETKTIINDKITVEQEIQTLISGKKNELNIMMFLPLIIVNQTRQMQGETSGDMLLSLIVKLVAFAMFVVAYVVGKKMMDIKV